MDRQAGMGLCFQYASFLIRLWRTADLGGKADHKWHSEVEHIQSGETWSFDSLAELEAFIHQQATCPEKMEWIDLKQND